jgi:hypothetical protein
MTKTLLSSAAFAALVLVAERSYAAIIIDPGQVGSTFTSLTIPFDDLNGMQLDGSPIVLDFDFVFADMKFLEVGFLPNTPVNGVYVEVVLFLDAALEDENLSLPDGFLSDVNGDPLTVEVVSRTTASKSTPPTVAKGLFFGDGLVDGLSFYDIHLSNLHFWTCELG